MAILGNTTINGSLNINGVPVEPGGNELLQVTCNTAASTVPKEGVASRAPVAGELVIVTFTNGNSVSSPTLKINSSDAKPIRLGTTAASTTTFTLGAGGVATLLYDGTNYNMLGSYRTSDANYYDRMYHNVAKQMGETLYRYKLILEGIDGKFYPIVTTNQTSATLVQKTPTNATLKIGGNILYYNTTATVAVDGAVTNTYSELSTANMVYSFNQNGGYQLQRPIYLVGIPQAGGGYKLDSNYYTQDLPTTEDGKIYIQLGIVYAQNSLRLEVENPIYEFKDGKVRPYIAEHTHTKSQITDLPTLRPTIELKVANLTTLTELEKLTIRNLLSWLIVDNKIDGTKFDDIVLVRTNDLIRLHYSSISYLTANSEITVIFETQETQYRLNVLLNAYTQSTLTSAAITVPHITVNNGSAESGKYISQVEVDGTNQHKLNITKENLPTIPTISTSITTDATSDTKTVSPKAVKTYVDNVLGEIETLLEGI